MSAGEQAPTPAGGAPLPTADTVLERHDPPRADEGSVWLHLAVIIVLALMIFLFRLGVADWRDECDTHEGLNIAQIMSGESWVLPLRNGRWVPEKPMLYAWLGAVGAKLRGSSGDLWDARLPSAVTALAGTLVVYWTARAMAGGAVALWSALILITTPQFIISGRDSRVDMVFCTFLTAALLLTWRVWDGVGGRRTAALAGLCFGLATLSKGPLALVLAVLVFGVTAVVAPPAPGWRLLLAPAPLLLSVGLPALWYAAATVEQGMTFLRVHIFAENVGRLIGGKERIPWYYIAPFIVQGLPWTIAFPAAVAGTPALSARHRRFLWAWVAAMFVFFYLSLGKRRVYLLPLRPALAILLAAWLVPQFARWRGRERATLPPAAVRAIIAASLFAMLALVLVLSFAPGGWGTSPQEWSYWWRLFFREHPGTILAFALVVGVGLDQFLRALWQRRFERAAFALVVGLAIGTTLAISSDEIVHGQGVSNQPLARVIAATVPPDQPLAFLDTDDENGISLQFDSRRHIAVTQSLGDHDACTPPAPGAYLIWESLWDARGCASDPAWQLIARGGPEVSTHRDRRMVFARYAPSTRSVP